MIGQDRLRIGPRSFRGRSTWRLNRFVATHMAPGAKPNFSRNFMSYQVQLNLLARFFVTFLTVSAALLTAALAIAGVASASS